MKIFKPKLKKQLEQLNIAGINLTLGELNAIESITAEKIVLNFGFPVSLLEPKLKAQIKPILDNDNQQIVIKEKIASYAVQQGLRGLDNVKNIIAIASGKGGVGKSTVCANLALALAQSGASVGVLDADIYGPNQAHMLGVEGQPEVVDEKKFIPVKAHGLQVMSMAFLINSEDTPMIWRGPMVSSALQQLLQETLWENLDYLLIDLPPGTGDIQLTLSQKIPVSGAIIVSTPQDIALLDAKKAIRMFNKVNINVLGVVENMSLHTCTNCGHEEAIFGEKGAEKMASTYDTKFLGALPLALKIREDADNGQPSVVATPEDVISEKYRNIALKAAAILSLCGTDPMRKFPKIVIES